MIQSRKNRPMAALALGAILAAIALLPAGSAAPQGASAAQQGPAAGQTIQRPEVLVIHLFFRDTAERDQLARDWSAEEASTAGGFVTVWGDRDTYNSMLAQGLHAEIDQATTAEANRPVVIGSGSPDTFYNGFKTVEEMQTFLDQMVAAHPTLAAKVDYGDSWCKVNPGACTQPSPYNGYDLFALHITNQAIPGPKPVFWYEAGIHSREIATPEIAMRYISWLLDGYDSNPDAHWLVDWHDIWVVPMFNPDGHHIVESGGGGASPYYQRKNANNTNGCTTWPPSVSNQFGVDNNRNFPFKWNCCGGSSGSPCSQTYHGVSAGSEPENQAMMAQVRLLIPDQRGPNDPDAAPLTTTGVLQDMHSNASLNLYPWGWTTTATSNGPEMAVIGQHMRALNADPPGNNYQSCQPPNCLYAVDGDANDWGYGELGIPALTTEVGGNDFFVPLSYVDTTLWPANRGALVYEAKVSRMPYLMAHGPDTKLVATNPMTVTQGSPSQLTATINYAWTGNTFAQNVGAAEYYIDTPPWAGGTAIPMNGAFSSQTVNVDATVDTTGLSVGRHLLFVRGRGVNDFSGYQTWGPVSAAFLDVLPSGGATPTATSTAVPPTMTSTAVPPTATSTAVPPTATAPASATATAQATVTTAPSATPGGPTATSTAGPTETPCGVTFSDVHPTDYFYIPVQYLACHGVISGYADGTFQPYNNTTRSQMVKIVVNAFNIPHHQPSNGKTFADVPPTHPFFVYIEAAAHAGIVSGYACGDPGERCDDQNRPYFRPYTSVTRGQLSKIVVTAASFTLVNPASPTFADVAPNTAFYTFVETAYRHQLVSGYTCGGPGEPCDAQNRPYFREGANATRGQIAKIVYNALTSGPPAGAR
jgi:carboxypeptidase T